MLWLLYIPSKIFCLKFKGLYDGNVVLLTKKEYCFSVHSIFNFYKSLKSISGEWLIAICWSFFLFGTFIIKKDVEFSLTSLGTLKYYCVIKTSKMFSFLPLINSSLAIGSNLFVINHISSHIMKDH